MSPVQPPRRLSTLWADGIWLVMMMALLMIRFGACTTLQSVTLVVLAIPLRPILRFRVLMVLPACLLSCR